MAKNPRSTTAVGSDADAATSQTVPGADAAASGATAGPLMGAGENTREGLATGEAGGPAKDPAVVGVSASQTVATPSKQEEVAAAANSAILDGRPEDASRAAEAAAGTALNAPSVGSGPAAEPFNRTIEHRDPLAPLGDISLADLALDRPAVVVGGPTVEVGTASGLPPAIMSREGAFGSAPEADRGSVAALLDAIEGDPRQRSSGYKRATPLPKDRLDIEHLISNGFDLIVTAKQDGFRRAGVGHPSAPTLRCSADFSAAELEAMDADPMLVVQALR